MARYIDKDASLAEIERLKKEEGWCQVGKDTADVYYARGFRFACERIKDTLDTLEVKEVDLEESARHYLLHEHTSPLNEVLHQADLKVELQYHEDIENAFKAGFELGLKIQKRE